MATAKKAVSATVKKEKSAPKAKAAAKKPAATTANAAVASATHVDAANTKAALASTGRFPMGDHPFFSKDKEGKGKKDKASAKKPTPKKEAKPAKVSKPPKVKLLLPVLLNTLKPIELEFSAKPNKLFTMGWSTKLDPNPLNTCEALKTTATEKKANTVAFSKLGLMTFFLTFNKAGEASVAQKVGKANALAIISDGSSPNQVKKLSLKKGSMVVPLNTSIHALGLAAVSLTGTKEHQAKAAMQ